MTAPPSSSLDWLRQAAQDSQSMARSWSSSRCPLEDLAVGAILGYLVSTVLLKHLDDHLIETAITLALAFGAYISAELMHVSGILAVVAAGILVGDIGLQNTSPTTKLSLLNFWELLSFVVNAFVFLLIGLRIDISLMAENLSAILVAVVTILFTRAVIVYSTSWVQNRVAAHQIHSAQFPAHDVLGRPAWRRESGPRPDACRSHSTRRSPTCCW